MTLYLGLLDATFYGRAGAFYPLTTNGAVELAIVLACIGGGLYGLRAAWMIWQASLITARPDHQTTRVAAATDERHPSLRAVA